MLAQKSDGWPTNRWFDGSWIGTIIFRLMNIRPLCLPDIGEVRTTVYSPLTVAGWGRVGYEEEQSDVLKSGQLWIENHHLCRRKFEKYFEIDPRVHICAYAPGEPLRATQGHIQWETCRM